MNEVPDNLKRFLEFNGKRVYFLAVDGTYWIAIKPICERLGVNYDRQRRNLKDDPILCQLPSVQTVVAADNRNRNMICLPEYFVYGWIFSIQSSKRELTGYKMKCYDILFNHFRGSITDRAEKLRGKSVQEIEIEKLEAELAETAQAKRIKELKAGVKNANQTLKKMDVALLEGQYNMFYEN